VTPSRIPTGESRVYLMSDPGTDEPAKDFSAGAMCVRLVDDRFVLRFTFLLAVRLGLPRPASRVIHRSELCTEFQRLSAPRLRRYRFDFFVIGGSRRGKPVVARLRPAPLGIGFRTQYGNDPSAGSPTDTLLRLLLPLNGRARRSFRPARRETQGIVVKADRSEGLARSFNR
jgi:hypothetical protein